MAMVEVRVDRLEKVLQEFITNVGNSQLRTEAELREFKEEMRLFREDTPGRTTPRPGGAGSQVGRTKSQVVEHTQGDFMVAEARALEKLRILQTLFRAGYQSDVISQTLDKLIALEQAHARQELATLQARLKAFESQYKMPSEDFYQRYEQGQLDDSADFMEWSSFYDMCRLVHQRLDWLMGKP